MLWELGFDELLIPHHVAATVSNSSWRHWGRAHAVAFIQAAARVAVAG